MKATITAKSAILADGSFQVTYDVLDSKGAVQYQNQTVQGNTVDDITAAISNHLANLQASADEAAQITIGETIG